MKSRETVRKVLTVILALVALACAGYLVWYYVVSEQTNASYDEARQIAGGSAESVDRERLNVLPEAENPIDFEALQEVNPDVYAWITIEGTNVDYPIVQRTDDDNYYLDHTWEGVSASQGAIFTQAFNQKNFMDFNTVIYGHQMGAGNDSMFHTLDRYLEEGFMEEHPVVMIYTPDHVYTYEVFAAVVYDDRHLMQYYNYVMDSERQKFLDSLYNSRDMRNQYRDGAEVTVDDRIISLSTCIPSEEEHRLLVEAVLVNES
ncbi:hypothetical protein K280104A7_18810 [Candidatus Bariatricus faecipullorum]